MSFGSFSQTKTKYLEGACGNTRFHMKIPQNTAGTAANGCGSPCAHSGGGVRGQPVTTNAADSLHCPPQMTCILHRSGFALIR